MIRLAACSAAPVFRRKALARTSRSSIVRAAVTVRAMSSSPPGEPWTLRLHGKDEGDLNAARHLLQATDLKLAAPGGAGGTAAAVRVVLPSTTAPASPAPSASGGAAFDADAFFGALATQRLGRVLLTAARLPSTQAFLQENRGALPDGAVCVADVQTSGKGRGKNAWDSPEGCLMFSVCTSLTLPGAQLPFVQYAVSIAVVHAVHAAARRALQQAGVPGAAAAAGEAAAVEAGALDLLRIKWPNDLYASRGGPKVGGILCHSAHSGGGTFNVTIGVGLNVANSQPTTCVNDLVAAAAVGGLGPASPSASAAARDGGGASSSGAALGTTQQRGQRGWRHAPVTREALLAGVLAHVEAQVGALLDRGFDALEAPYLAAWLHSGQRVTLEERVPAAAAGVDGRGGGGGSVGAVAGATRSVSLTVRGLTRSGYLRAEDDEGVAYELHPDGNSLDFFQGLIRAKLP